MKGGVAWERRGCDLGVKVISRIERVGEEWKGSRRAGGGNWERRNIRQGGIFRPTFSFCCCHLLQNVGQFFAHIS